MTQAIAMFGTSTLHITQAWKSQLWHIWRKTYYSTMLMQKVVIQ